MPNQCANCKKNVTKVLSPGLSCVSCNKFWHFKCTELSETTTKEIISNKLSWTCKKCNRRSTILPPPPDNAPSCSLSLSPAVASTSRLASSSTLFAKIQTLEDLLASAITRIEDLERKLAAREEKEKKLSLRVEKLESHTSNLEKQLTDNILEIQGLPETALEDPSSAVIAIGDAIGCKLSLDDLEEPPFRVSKRISITFKSRIKRRSFLTSGKNFNKEKKKIRIDQHHHRIHINEVLSEQQKKLFRETKAFASEHNFKFVWVGISGHILLKKDENSSLNVITSSHSLSSLLQYENNVPELQGASNEDGEMQTNNNRP